MDDIPYFRSISPAGRPMQYWAALRALHYYRLTVATLLLLVFLFDSSHRLLVVREPEAFATVLVSYLVVLLLTLPGGFLEWPRLGVQAGLLALVDLVVLVLLAGFAGGLQSDLLSLLVIAIAAAGVLLPLAALLPLVLLIAAALGGLWLWQDPPALEQLTAALRQPWLLPDLLSAYTAPLSRIIVLSSVALLASLVTYSLAERTRRSDRLMAEQTAATHALDRLNRAIVRQIQFGILVVDRQDRLLLANDTAQSMLGCPGAAVAGVKLDTLSPGLAFRLSQWRGGATNPKPLRVAKHLPELSLRFSGLGLDPGYSSSMITMEDYREIEQQLQRLKLAALGRMSASIAHELRNPMTAIHQAAQLLQESPDLGKTQQRLAGIISNNIRRADRIINEVMSLARRRPPEIETLPLQQWLRQWREEFLLGRGELPPQIALSVEPADLAIRFDPGHLRQIIDNLASNSCQHGAPPGQAARIHIRCQRGDVADRLVIDFSDSGPGIAADERHRLFEPFHTTSAHGTGLGLYLARELCEANQATLRYIGEAGCFRIEAQAAEKPALAGNW